MPNDNPRFAFYCHAIDITEDSHQPYADVSVGYTLDHPDMERRNDCWLRLRVFGNQPLLGPLALIRGSGFDRERLASVYCLGFDLSRPTVDLTDNNNGLDIWLAPKGYLAVDHLDGLLTAFEPTDTRPPRGRLLTPRLSVEWPQDTGWFAL
ncbi:hypothetical protein RM531_08000 [Salinisphaera sp. P385]|uniref:Uncharacterized protein n=1 Tax=Spectribacter acetivorans TaxID=3075603 RepID=A0ABU3B7H5_9GAMM|nr:hypothetical protein [Salinisphaera sp. P385]MDT0618416.1 hypothetical protein [Salinisphaera sp. P385]